jgi:hypothetical protein
MAAQRVVQVNCTSLHAAPSIAAMCASSRTEFVLRAHVQDTHSYRMTQEPGIVSRSLDTEWPSLPWQQRCRQQVCTGHRVAAFRSCQLLVCCCFLLRPCVSILSCCCRCCSACRVKRQLRLDFASNYGAADMAAVAVSDAHLLAACCQDQLRS